MQVLGQRPFDRHLPVFSKLARHRENLPIRRKEGGDLLLRGTALTSIANEVYTITHRLHALEARLDLRRFVPLGRGTLANVDLIHEGQPDARWHVRGYAVEWP